MLRVTVDNNVQPTRLIVEGRLCGPWVTELEKEWARLTFEVGSRNVVADLSEVTFIDAEGRELLARMLDQGTELHAFNLLSRFVIDEIRVALQRRRRFANAHAR